MLEANYSLNGNYTVFGNVVSGMEFIDLINKGDPTNNSSFSLDSGSSGLETPGWNSGA